MSLWQDSMEDWTDDDYEPLNDSDEEFDEFETLKEDELDVVLNSMEQDDYYINLLIGRNGEDIDEDK